LKKIYKLKKVVIPIAGLGTRMLPATKAIPKEMLPIVDKPIIQYVVEEAVEAGFKEIIFITHSSKSSVENHFDTSFELEAALEKRLKRSALKEIRSISKLNVLIHSVRQGEAKGLGHAILCAKTIIGKEPFAVMLPDMVIDGSKNNNLSIMKQEFEKTAVSSILLGNAKKEDFNKYGLAKVKRIPKEKFFQITKMVEKPTFSKAPSNLFAVGRYILSNEIFNFLSKVKPDKSGEIQLTNAIDSYIQNKNNVLGFNLNGRVFDCGEKIGLLIANIEFAKKDKNLSKSLSKYLNK
tara:strand:+ start:18436 stop:19314 length:879 start_codon:yes stop_codon:yes gene_type:complete